MKYWLFLMIGLTILGCKSKGEPKELTWLTIEEADKIAQGKNNKKFIVDVYTDWCGWCKVMDKKTFTDPEVIAYINEHFHVVKFNAEQREPVQYKGKTYEWVSSGRSGVNRLGYELLKGRLSYPSLVYMNEKMEPITVSLGYKEPVQLLNELKGL
ncbi:MAG: DUF255 domain-containing protein [Saprospiraceae bacterium]|nr:MAG: thioredoxin-like protein [Bacteroidetes bacterium OLB9]MCO6463177.1 DUF255 domain-containing protein [Saprospiraceae bacterium]